MVIPRFCLHLEKQMNALTTHYRDRCEQEPDPAARAKMVDDLKIGLREQNSHHTHLAKEVTEMLSKLNNMKDTVHQFTDQINNDREHQKERANASLAHLVLEDERDVAKVKYEAPEFLALSPFRFEDVPLTSEIFAPRAFSIKQIRELVYTFLHTSSFREEFLHMKSSYEEFKDYVKEQNQ
jgi:predicted nuclease with TOPRIM domain